VDGDTASAGAAAGAVTDPVVSLLPQFAQNLARGGLLCPQEGHPLGSDAPHSMQNLLPSGTSALQVRHSMPQLNLQKSSAYHTTGDAALACHRWSVMDAERDHLSGAPRIGIHHPAVETGGRRRHLNAII
jgi:hypothetical protein